MRALVWHGKEDVRVDTVPDPTIQDRVHPDVDRKSTRLNSSHTEIYTLSLHDALPIWKKELTHARARLARQGRRPGGHGPGSHDPGPCPPGRRSEEHTSELQSHRDLHSFPTRRSSDLEEGTDACARSSGTARKTSGWTRSRIPRSRTVSTRT